MICPVCRKADCFRTLYEIEKGTRRILLCECGHQLIFPPPTKEELSKIYNEEYYTFWKDKSHFRQMFDLRVKTCNRLLAKVNQRISSHRAKRHHLDIGCAFGYMLEAAKQHGYISQGLEISYAVDEAVTLGYNVRNVSLENAGLPSEYFDLITAVDVIEHIPEPIKWIKECSRILKKGGIILLVTPDCSSLSARVRKSKWPHYHLEHIHYYSPDTIKRILSGAGFDELTFIRAMKYFNMNYLRKQLEKYHPHRVETRIIKAMSRVLPSRLLKYAFPCPSGMVALAKKK